MGAQGSQILLVLGIGLFVFVLVNRVRRSIRLASRNRAHDWRQTSEMRSSISVSRGMPGGGRMKSSLEPREKELWEVEMHKLARELKAELDTKMRALERLIQMADEACGQLQTSIDRAESLGLIEDNLSPGERLDQPEAAATAAIRSGGDTRGPAMRSARRDLTAVRMRLGENLADDPRFERVYALADAGFSASKIASQVGSQIGEVELILSLRSSHIAIT